MDKISNPHDKLLKEIWSDRKEARSFFENYLPQNVLELIDLDSLEIAKDSFVEEDLRDSYSDLLYSVKFEKAPGYLYLLIEHKSHKDKLIHLQLLGYINNICKLHIKQTKGKTLPVVIPLVLYHGKNKWEVNTRFSSLISGPYQKLKAYIPDFDFVLYDLTRYDDKAIKGSILSQIMLLLFKHFYDKDFIDKLPGILSLINELTIKDADERSIETILIYLFGTVEITVDKVHEIVRRSIPADKGDLVMTLAERLRNEGFQRGVQQGVQQGIQQGVREGLVEGIELALMLKFGNVPENQRILDIIKNVQNIDKLKTIKTAILEVQSVSELLERLTQ